MADRRCIRVLVIIGHLMMLVAIHIRFDGAIIKALLDHLLLERILGFNNVDLGIIIDIERRYSGKEILLGPRLTTVL
jgi:hypothetical protein